MKPSQIITIAAAQMVSQDGKIHENLEHASRFVAEASTQGAQLVLFPEFMPQGYRLTPDLFSAAEPFDGPTTRWLCEQGRKFGVHIGTSFLECDGKDFWNTFVLSTPAGKIAGSVRKAYPSIWEAYFFKGYRGPHTIETSLGRIGVGICFDNHTYAVARAIADSQVDLMLMPHSYCTPTQISKMISQTDIDRLNDNPIRVARLYNQWLGVPVVLVNKSGSWDSPVPQTILGQPINYSFSGRSQIIDADGSIQAQLGTEEGLAAAAVHLDPECKKSFNPPKYSRYIYPGPAGREILRLIEYFGNLNYQLSSCRRQAAQDYLKTRN